MRARVRPRIAEQARVATFLADEGLALNDHAYTLFVDAVSDNLLAALTLLERRAQGDYTPDTTPESFPTFTGPHASKADGLSCWQLFEEFVNATKPADKTVQRWRTVFLHLQAEFPHTSATAITEADARAWARKLVTPKRTAATVKVVWVSAARRVFSWAEKQKHIRKSPFIHISVDVPRKPRNRETQAFKPAEVRLILKAALAHEQPKSTFDRAKRWVMWLCAYSGARSGEITQLRGMDVEKRGAFHVMKLTPDAGTMKTGEARIVPIHEHLIEQGFIEFVRQVGQGALFYNERRPAPETKADPLNPRRAPAVSVRSSLGSWVRELGVTDPEVSPTHGWRHTFKQVAERAGITEKVHDAITGHKPPSEGRKYGAPTVEDMAAAMEKFPRYQLEEEWQELRCRQDVAREA